MSRSEAYWQDRARETMDIVHAGADQRLDVIRRATLRAVGNLTDDAKRILGNYQKRFDLTYEEAMAYLREPAGRAEYERLLAKIAAMPPGPEKLQLQAKASSGAYAFRISRAEALQDNIKAETAKLAALQETETTAQRIFAAGEGYGRTLYGIQARIGGWAVPDLTGMRAALATGWKGANYSQRIWGHRDELAATLEETITSAFLSGRSYAKTARDIQAAFGVNYNQAETLVRTDSSYVAGQADKAAYEDADIDEYSFLTGLDEAVCKLCGPLDHKVFPVSEAAPGENYPPKHPRCRCTTVAKIQGHTAALRRGRGGEGRNVLLPGDMDYEEWARWQADGAPPDIAAWRKSPGNLQEPGTAMRMAQNRHADTEQFKRYQKMGIGEGASLQAFQRMKYEVPEEYAVLKADYRQRLNDSRTDKDVMRNVLIPGTKNGTIQWGTASFATPESAERHFQKHRDEYGGTLEEYIETARGVLSTLPSDDAPYLIRSDGSVSRYRISTNDFAVGTKEGRIRTLFKPQHALDYWKEELKRNE